MHSPLHSEWKMQSRMTMFREGRPMERPSVSRPDLMAMASSPVRKVQRSMSTFDVPSGSQPSLLGKWLSMVTPRTMTLSQSTGWMVQKGESLMVTPSMSTREQPRGWMHDGRRTVPLPKTRSWTGTSLSPISRRRSRSGASIRLHAANSLPPWASMVPLPVMAMLLAW